MSSCFLRFRLKWKDSGNLFQIPLRSISVVQCHNRYISCYSKTVKYIKELCLRRNNTRPKQLCSLLIRVVYHQSRQQNKQKRSRVSIKIVSVQTSCYLSSYMSEEHYVYSCLFISANMLIYYSYIGMRMIILIYYLCVFIYMSMNSRICQQISK